MNTEVPIEEQVFKSRILERGLLSVDNVAQNLQEGIQNEKESVRRIY